MQILPIRNYNFDVLSFCAKEKIKNKNVGILGSSKTTEEIKQYMDIASLAAKYAVLCGNKVVTGCGKNGIMGSAYRSAAKYSSKNSLGKPVDNLVILKEPLKGDEDLNNCVVIGTTKSEPSRIDKFIATADAFFIFPGGPGTILEASSLISNNYYTNNHKQVILVGREYFKNLDNLYKQMKDSGIIKCELDKLYTIIDSVDEIKENFFDKIENQDELFKTDYLNRIPIHLSNISDTLAILESANDSETIDKMLFWKDATGRIPLHYSIRGNSRKAQMIINATDEQNAQKMMLIKNKHGKIPLFYASNQGAKLLFDTADNDTKLKMLFSQSSDNASLPINQVTSASAAKEIIKNARSLGVFEIMMSHKDNDGNTPYDSPYVKKALLDNA